MGMHPVRKQRLIIVLFIVFGAAIAVEIIGGATIKLTLSRNISSSAYVSYAGNLRNGTGNVRDSHKWVSKYNYADETSLVSPSYTPLDENGNNLYGKKYPCYNWLSAFYKELN